MVNTWTVIFLCNLFKNENLMFIIFKKRMGIFTTENFYSSDFKLNVKFDIELILNAIRISLNVFILLVVFFFYLFFFIKQWYSVYPLGVFLTYCLSWMVVYLVYIYSRLVLHVGPYFIIFSNHVMHDVTGIAFGCVWFIVDFFFDPEQNIFHNKMYVIKHLWFVTFLTCLNEG